MADRLLANIYFRKKMTDINHLREEYLCVDDVFSENSTLHKRVKCAIASKLNVSQQTLIFLYAEHRSLRKLANVLGVSKTTIRDEIARIKKIIKENIV